MPPRKTNHKQIVNKKTVNIIKYGFMPGLILGLLIALLSTFIMYKILSSAQKTNEPPANFGVNVDFGTTYCSGRNFCNYPNGIEQYKECVNRCAVCVNQCVSASTACNSKCPPGVNECSQQCTDTNGKCMILCIEAAK